MLPRNAAKSSASILLSQLSWFIRLRWVVASAVALVGLLDLRWPSLVGRPVSLLVLSAVIFLYNWGMGRAVDRAEPADRRRLHVPRGESGKPEPGSRAGRSSTCRATLA